MSLYVILRSILTYLIIVRLQETMFKMVLFCQKTLRLCRLITINFDRENRARTGLIHKGS